MANTAVIYKSNYGATRKYAAHIADSLGADLYDLKHTKKIDFEKYDTIIYGGGLYANKVNGIKFISSNAEDLSGKALVIFTTGISDPTLAQNAQKILKSVNKALPKPFRSRAHVFSFRGGIDYSELGFMHRTMMSMLKKSIEKKSESDRTDDEKMILEYYGKVCDMTDTSTAVPLIEYVKSLK